MIVRYNDRCQSCGYSAANHTVGVFYKENYPRNMKNIDEVKIEEVWENQLKFSSGLCKQFRHDNLKYLEMKYEESLKAND